MKTQWKFFLLIVTAVFLLVGCEFQFGPSTMPRLLPREENKKLEPIKPPPTPQHTVIPTKVPTIPPESEITKTTQAEGFTVSDCGLNGLTFPNITTGSKEFDPFDGPYLVCDSVTSSGDGLNIILHIEINAIMPESVTSYFEEKKSIPKTFVDNAIAWKEKNPTVGTEVAMIRDDEEGYIYLILTKAHVQQCLLGEGYGVEIMDQYLVYYNFSSCEADTALYIQAIEMLRETARKAIERVGKK